MSACQCWPQLKLTVAVLPHVAHARACFVTHIISRILQEDATEHVGAVLKRVKHEYLVSAEQYNVHQMLCCGNSGFFWYPVVDVAAYALCCIQPVKRQVCDASYVVHDDSHNCPYHQMFCDDE